MSCVEDNHICTYLSQKSAMAPVPTASLQSSISMAPVPTSSLKSFISAEYFCLVDNPPPTSFGLFQYLEREVLVDGDAEAISICVEKLAVFLSKYFSDTVVHDVIETHESLKDSALGIEYFLRGGFGHLAVRILRDLDRDCRIEVDNLPAGGNDDGQAVADGEDEECLGRDGAGEDVDGAGEVEEIYMEEERWASSKLFLSLM